MNSTNVLSPGKAQYKIVHVERNLAFNGQMFGRHPILTAKPENAKLYPSISTAEEVRKTFGDKYTVTGA